MLAIGCHLSTAKGYLHMGEEALSIGAATFQFFTRNPRGGNAKKVNVHDAAALRTLMDRHDFAPLLAHAPYTLNACSADPGIRDFARRVMAEDMDTLDAILPGTPYNFHPGSHVGQGIETGVAHIVAMLDEVLRPGRSVTVLLETMSGKGSEVGSRFEELAAIIDRVLYQERLGVCLDTCHVYSAGYDIVGDLDGVLEQFQQIIGLDRLRAIHLNDSLTPFASRKDRHARIGEGSIGLDALVRVINHPQLRSLPFYLETPNELPGYAQEINLLRSVWRNEP